MRYYRNISGDCASQNDVERAAADEFVIELISGREGDCIAISRVGSGGIRVAGPKPWGGGHVIQTWRAGRADLLNALGIEEYTPEPSPSTTPTAA